MSEIVILDYGIGNIRSIKNAIIKIGGQAIVSRDFDVIKNAAGLIIPGVGAFQHGMNNLKKYNLVEQICNYANTGKPVLGICLGMQLMLSSSDENGFCAGLNLIPGAVKKIYLTQDNIHRLPHIRWSRVLPLDGRSWDEDRLGKNNLNQYFYFVHSYMAQPNDIKHILAITKYGNVEITAVINKDNVMGCQFHPEKSGEQGLNILKNFLNSTQQHVN